MLYYPKFLRYIETTVLALGKKAKAPRFYNSTNVNALPASKLIQVVDMLLGISSVIFIKDKLYLLNLPEDNNWFFCTLLELYYEENGFWKKKFLSLVKTETKSRCMCY